MSTPGIAGEDAFEGQPAAFKWSVFGYGFYAVGAAAGIVAAFGTKKGRDRSLVYFD